jgi:hypothetical protein
VRFHVVERQPLPTVHCDSRSLNQQYRHSSALKKGCMESLCICIDDAAQLYARRFYTTLSSATLGQKSYYDSVHAAIAI